MSVSVCAAHLFNYAGAGEPVHGYIRGIVYVGYIAEGKGGEGIELVEAVPCLRCTEDWWR